MLLVRRLALRPMLRQWDLMELVFHLWNPGLISCHSLAMNILHLIMCLHFLVLISIVDILLLLVVLTLLGLAIVPFVALSVGAQVLGLVMWVILVLVVGFVLGSSIGWLWLLGIFSRHAIVRLEAMVLRDILLHLTGSIAALVPHLHLNALFILPRKTTLLLPLLLILITIG